MTTDPLAVALAVLLAVLTLVSIWLAVRAVRYGRLVLTLFRAALAELIAPDN